MFGDIHLEATVEGFINTNFSSDEELLRIAGGPFSATVEGMESVDRSEVESPVQVL